MKHSENYAGHCTWPEFAQKIRESKGVILVCGSCEQHGHHLPGAFHISGYLQGTVFMLHTALTCRVAATGVDRAAARGIAVEILHQFVTGGICSGEFHLHGLSGMGGVVGQAVDEALPALAQSGIYPECAVGGYGGKTCLATQCRPDCAA